MSERKLRPDGIPEDVAQWQQDIGTLLGEVDVAKTKAAWLRLHDLITAFDAQRLQISELKEQAQRWQDAESNQAEIVADLWRRIHVLESERQAWRSTVAELRDQIESMGQAAKDRAIENLTQAFRKMPG